MFIRLSGVSFSFADSVALLSAVNLDFHPGWTGIVGQNGSGKTTLIRLIAGQLEPDRGHVRSDPAGLATRLCPQTAEALTAEIAAFARAADGDSRRLHGRLRLDSQALSRWPTLSPGERKRWQIGAALATQPGVLILDEPTDHLDFDARELLVAGLRNFRGIGLLVSHDRTLLNELTSNTVRFDDGAIKLWRGSYDIAKSGWESAAREYHDAYLHAREKRDRVVKRLADTRRAVARIDNTSTKSRMKGPRDHDATGMMTKGRERAAATRFSRDVRVLRRKTERITDELGSFKFRKQPGRSLFVDYVPAPVPRLLTLDRAELRAGSRTLLTDVHVALTRDSRIHVAGPNGIGKTTLLNALLAHAQVPQSRLLHLPQELTNADARALLDSVRALGPDDRNRVLTLVAALGVEPDRLLESICPSPGEARKLKIAYGLGRQVWALILDEPTNHLDMPSIERLEAALRDYPGALLMVTHDDALARRCTTIEWRLESGRLREL